MLFSNFQDFTYNLPGNIPIIFNVWPIILIHSVFNWCQRIQDMELCHDSHPPPVSTGLEDKDNYAKAQLHSNDYNNVLCHQLIL